MPVRNTLPDGSCYCKTRLRNGLRVVTETIPSVRSISLGVWIDVGSRNETDPEAGLSHLIEHMVFKGTHRRNAKQIAASLESIGGNLNAFTSREQTCYLARVLDDHLETAVDVLADIVCNPAMTPVNLKREKMVVCEEIKESIENPSDNIHDIFAEAYWGAHPLGRPIMGSMQSIVEMPRKRLMDYIKSNYRCESIVIAASGSVSHDKLVKLVRKHFDFPPGKPEPAIQASRENRTKVKVVPDKNKQAHLSLGFPGIGYHDKDRMTALVLNSYLGGGMSSVLFQKIREERGLAYSVYTFLDFYREAGIFGAYLGSDVNQLGQAVNIILAETSRLKKRKLSQLRLNQVKQQLKGQVTLGMESTSSRMNRLARQELVLDRYISLNETLNEIDGVTSSEVMTLANRIFNRSQLTVAVRGPAKNGFLDDVLTD